MESWIRPAQLPFALHNHSENLEKSQNSKKKAEVCLANFERQTLLYSKGKGLFNTFSSNSHILCFCTQTCKFGSC